MIALIALMSFLVLFGILFLKGKGKFRLAGYNMDALEENGKINIKKLRIRLAASMFIDAGIVFALILSVIFGIRELLLYGVCALIIFNMITIILMNSRKRSFRK